MKQILLALTLVASPLLRAEDHGSRRGEAPAPEQFKVDKNLLEDMYRAEIRDVAIETRYSTGAIEVGPQFSMVTASQFETTNNYFSVPYNSLRTQIPLVHLVMTTPITLVAGFVEVHAQGRIGYNYREGVYTVRARSGQEFSDLVKLNWLPITAGLRLGAQLPIPIKPTVTIGAGAQWLAQDGLLDGLDQNFWVPFYQISPAVTLFDLSERGGWFGGINVGATINRSVASQQKINYWSIDLSTALVL